MNRVKIPLSSILVKDRQRLDYGDLGDLKTSLQLYGLIQPIVLNQDRRLIAGGRRLEAATQLGWTEIDACFRDTLSDDELHVLELEENIRRKEEVWQERCLHIAHIHQLKSRSAALDGKRWAQKMTGEMLGISDCHVNFNLKMAALLRAELSPDNKPLPSARFWSCSTFAEAWRLLLRDEEQSRVDLLAKLTKEQFSSTNDSTKEDDFGIDLAPTSNSTVSQPPTSDGPQEVTFEEDEVIAGFSRNSSWAQAAPTGISRAVFDERWAKFKAVQFAKENTLRISDRFIHSDSIAYMNLEVNANRFDHIITDIPYGIDMDMLNQQNPHGGMSNIDLVENEHQVDANKQLIAAFFPAAFKCTKDKAFIITWCDQMLWQFMYDCAIKAGFAVQRWPITWHKTSSCMNQCAQYNFTKNTEIAIVCRKPGATLRCAQSSSVVISGKDDLTSKINHPFAKPFLIWQFLVDAVAISGQHILEPFAGRGSGVISMLEMGMAVTGVECNEQHYNCLLENVKQHYLSLNPNFIFK